ncbi:tRNA dihydrouridine(20/20a) synthase DusA [Oceanibacterium hippocampi]|uniref:tRNA-dihydrouridine(20/20a) synthase n=1 Tax=Oceanibacterium hippocampi TaxID=745714 RepID=A0A1Y5SEQ3_9PROT|nr:tRNA dihydrouridine(20/20a) synthase DusA [Oceanibacterium hippocampi]SLN36300.1 putative tRNA-dihydrouridine synthase [Oceanibacterium hippocampi]
MNTTATDMPFAHPVSVAPMMDWTDRHDRFFLRLISRRALLYTEMVTTAAILHGDRQRLLGHEPAEHPLALQLGGSDPAELARAARIGADYGYDEINLNVGCPSDRVQSGRFGACLMAEPELVAEGVAAMRAAVDIPVTVKTRIGIDDRDSYEELHGFVAGLVKAGTERLIVHARKAWLNGLSPKQNREIPPLRYDVVYRLKADCPDLVIVINGGIRKLDEIDEHLRHVDGVMIGREAYQNPYLLAEIDGRYYGEPDEAPARKQVVEELIPYIRARQDEGVPLNSITRHVLGLFQGLPGARAWRRHLSENAHRPEADASLLAEAAARVRAG